MKQQKRMLEFNFRHPLLFKILNYYLAAGTAFALETGAAFALATGAALTLATGAATAGAALAFTIAAAKRAILRAMLLV